MNRRYLDDDFYGGAPARGRYAGDDRGFDDDRYRQQSQGMWNEHRQWPERGSQYERGPGYGGSYSGDDHRGWRQASHGYGHGSGDYGSGYGMRDDERFGGYPGGSARGPWGGSQGGHGAQDDGQYGSGQGFGGARSRTGSADFHGGQSGRGSYSSDADLPYDPDYDQWRREQMRSLDEDYRNWRGERYKKFSDDFSTWRSNRPAGSSSSAASVSGQSASKGSTKE